MSYRPIDDLLLRATRGTAFRAPNLRETALRDEVDTIMFMTIVTLQEQQWH